MTWLKMVNVFIFQWFFIRLAKIIDDESNKIIAWSIVRWIVPGSGWRSDYKIIGKLKHYVFIGKGAL